MMDTGRKGDKAKALPHISRRNTPDLELIADLDSMASPWAVSSFGEACPRNGTSAGPERFDEAIPFAVAEHPNRGKAGRLER